MTTNGSMVVHEDRPALAKATPVVEQTRAFEPRDISEAVQMAKLLVASGLMPRGVQRPESAFAIIATGRELGLTAMQSIRSIHIIEGKPTLSADLIAALVKSRPEVCVYFRLVESTDKVATYETQRRGEPEPTRMSFSIEDASRAGVTGKDNWRKYPAAMLRARAITALARAVYPDLAMGLYDPDEVVPEAVPAMPPRVVSEVAAPAAKPEPVVDPRLFEDFCRRVDEAETGAALNAIAKDASRAAKTGALAPAFFEEIKAAVTRKRGLIGAPKPPKSEPKVEDDPDGRAELDGASERDYDDGSGSYDR